MRQEETRHKVVLVLVTCRDRKEADKISGELVSSGLAACVNALPVMSIYRWRGRVEKASEVMLLIKARAGNVRKIATKVEALHSYEVPEVIALPVVGGSRKYLEWVEGETKRINIRGS